MQQMYQAAKVVTSLITASNDSIGSIGRQLHDILQIVPINGFDRMFVLAECALNVMYSIRVKMIAEGRDEEFQRTVLQRAADSFTAVFATAMDSGLDMLLNNPEAAGVIVRHQMALINDMASKHAEEVAHSVTLNTTKGNAAC